MKWMVILLVLTLGCEEELDKFYQEDADIDAGESDGDTEGDTDTEESSDSGGDGDTDTDTDADADTDTDTDADTGSDTGAEDIECGLIEGDDGCVFTDRQSEICTELGGTFRMAQNCLCCVLPKGMQ